MSDYVATIQVDPTQKAWRAEDVPNLTADAYYRFEPEPDPVYAKSELRRFKPGEVLNQAAGRALNPNELSRFARNCRAAGLPALPDECRYSRWREFINAGNRDAELRGWSADLLPPRDPHEAARLGWVIATEEHRKLLKKAIADGTIEARMAGTGVPKPNQPIALDRLELTRAQLEKFAALLAIQVVDAPHFVTAAWPREVPPQLRSLAADDMVFFEHKMAGSSGGGHCKAGEYRAEIEATIERQSEGFFTLTEAAQVLADSRPGLEPVAFVKRLLLAHSKGELPIHQRESRLPLEMGETVRDFWDTVQVHELDAWLRASAGYGFPVEALRHGVESADFNGHAMDADFWFGQALVTPEQAAMLLKQVNPNDPDARESASRDKSHDGGQRLEPRHFNMLKLAFEDAERQSGQRTLLAWLEVARQRGLAYHSWVDEFVAVRGLQAEGKTLSPSGEYPGDPKPKQRQQAQEEIIIQRIQDAGFNPKALPKVPPGTPGVKSQIRSALKGHELFVGDKVFEKAWERLRGNGDIADALSPFLG